MKPLIFTAVLAIAFLHPSQCAPLQEQQISQSANHDAEPKGVQQCPPSAIFNFENGEELQTPTTEHHPKYDQDYALWGFLVNLALVIATAIIAGYAVIQAKAALKGAGAAEANAKAVESQDQTLKDTLERIDKQADLMERQTVGIERSILLAHRPRLIVRNVLLEADLSANTLFKEAHYGYFDVCNVGGGHATVIESHWLQYIGPLPMRRPFEGKERKEQVTLTPDYQPGESKRWTFMIEPIERRQIELSLSPHGPPWFFVMGFIKYRDDLGIVRETAFCRQFSGMTFRFSPTDDPDYEYAD